MAAAERVGPRYTTNRRILCGPKGVFSILRTVMSGIGDSCGGGLRFGRWTPDASFVWPVHNQFTKAITAAWTPQEFKWQK